MPRRKQARRMTVQDIRSILRLTHQQGLSIREVGLRLKLSKTTVATYLYRAREAGLNCWPLPPGRDDDATLERALFQQVGRPPRAHEEPDWAKVSTELKRKGVTLVRYGRNTARFILTVMARRGSANNSGPSRTAPARAFAIGMRQAQSCRPTMLATRSR